MLCLTSEDSDILPQATDIRLNHIYHWEKLQPPTRLIKGDKMDGFHEFKPPDQDRIDYISLACPEMATGRLKVLATGIKGYCA